MLKELLTDLGLAACPPFYRDRQFVLAVVGGAIAWLVAWAVFPDCFASPTRQLAVLLSLILWQPLLEELLFRGVLQGQLGLRSWWREKHFGISRANLATSFLFVLGHLFYHAPFWALAVFVPSLLFGHFRERHASVYPALALHVYYNAGYFLIGLTRTG